METRKSIRVVWALLIMSSLMLIGIHPASAYQATKAVCPQKADQKLTQVARGEKPAPTGAWRSTEGVIGNFAARYRPVNTDCTGTLYGSGVFMRLINSSGKVTNDYVGIEWNFYEDGNPDTPDFAVWSEAKINGNFSTGGSCFTTGCLTAIGWAIGGYCDYKVNRVSGTTDWNAWINCNAGAFELIGTFSNTGYGKGVATSATWRRGGTATGMEDAFQTLQYRNSNGVWNYWTHNKLYNDDANGWESSSIIDTAYHVTSCSSPC
jgi:hypothetical protein